MNMKKTINYILPSAFIIIFILLVIASLLHGSISRNPAGTIGNSAGNLNNKGLFCEQDGTVYFSNAADNGRLYAMNSDETNIRKLSNLQVQNILVGGKYLYYFQLGASGEAGIGNIISVSSFNRSDLKGKDIAGLTRDTVISAQLVDNDLYLLTPTPSGCHLYKMKTDKSESIELADYEINPSCAVDGIIYYNGTGSNHYLYGLDTATGSVREIWKGNIWNPVVEGDYVYYMDVENDYRLCRYSMSRNLIEVLTNDRVDCFNPGYGYIYYQKNGDTPQLKCMRTDGTEVMVIAEGNYTNINITSQYVYFQEFGVEDSLYHSPLGSAGCSRFVPLP